jgi:hypothetical protein
MWVLTASLAVALTACASRRTETEYREVEYRDSRFTAEPRMRPVTDTGVEYIRDGSSTYDLYRFEGTWYLYDDDWFRADSWRGPFVAIEANNIPDEIMTIPAEYRRNWVAVKRDTRNRDLPAGYWASARTFGTKPDMTSIPGTGVRYARRAPDFDLYRYRGTYYLMDDGVWYRSSTWRGPFLSIRVGSVPDPVLNVPRGYRRYWESSAADERPYRRDRRDRRDRDYRDDRDDRDTRTWSSGRTLASQPRMYVMPNTSVFVPRDELGFDLYRFGTTWYVLDDGGWYRSETWRGPYLYIRANAVPVEVRRIRE